MKTRNMLYRLISVGVALAFLFVMGMSSFAQDDEAPVDETATTEVAEEEVAFATVEAVETVQTNLNQTWLLLAAFLVFFMQAGFAMLEGGFIHHTGVINSMAENFMDACVTALVFFAVGFGVAYGNTLGAGTYESGMFFLGGINGTSPGDGITFIDFFFQFAFAGAAATIATGAMAERTDFRGKLIYSAILGALLYPVVVHWTWGGGLLAGWGFIDFAGSTIVHQFGGIIALVGAIVVGARYGREFGNPPQPANMMMASLGTFILWFGWYGFNVGSTLAADNPNIMGLVAVNTTLAAAAGALAAMIVFYIREQKWNLSFILNGSLAGLVGITAGCAFVAPYAAIIIGLTAGVVVVFTVDVVESSKVDDAVGAFAVHGACGALGSLAIGFWGIPALTETAGGLFMGGGFTLLGIQLAGVVVVAIWATVTGVAVFVPLKMAGLLRINEKAEEMGIDAYEHDAALYGHILQIIPDKKSAEPAGD
jgi:ammonium transporter, Amt family